jgi:hypothetical protein
MQQQSEVKLGSKAEAQMLMVADIERRELEQQTSQSAIFVGAGFILIAIGWLGRDALKSRQARGTALAEKAPS